MAGVTESLAGRASVLQLATLSYAEVLRALPQTLVEDMIVRGGFPELYENPELDAHGFYQSYVATYLERDLRTVASGESSRFRAILARRPSARPGCSTGPKWRAMWESVRRRPASGSRFWSALES